MLFSADAWPGIADGSLTVTFRTWTRPQAKTGGRYRVAGMLLEATHVGQVAVRDITPSDLRNSGNTDRAALIERLGNPPLDTLVWRVEFRYVGRDDRTERGQHAELTDDEIAGIRARLDRLDRTGRATRLGGAWTTDVLRLIERYPGIVSTALAARAGRDRADFKLDIRKLKELGLTESLTTGYRLTARGEAVLRALTRARHRPRGGAG